MVIEVEKWKLGWYVILLSTALLLTIALNRGSLTMAFAVIGLSIVVIYFYSEQLKKRGEVFQDERILRIEEITSRRTLQILSLTLAFAIVSLAILSQTYSNLQSAYYLSLGLMVMIAFLKLVFRRYYERVM